MSIKGESLSPDSLPAVSSDGGSPRVVIGIPDSEPPASMPSEVPAPIIEVKGPVTMPSFTKTLVQDTLIHDFVPPLEAPSAPEPVAEAEAEVPLKLEAPLTLEEPVPALKKDLNQTLVFGSSLPSEDDAPKPIQGALLPQAKDRLEELRQRKESRDRLKQQRVVAEAALKAEAPSADPDEVSVPPAGDLEVEDQTFFERGEKEAQAESQRIFQAAAAAIEAEADALIPEKARRKSMPHIVQRRAKLAGYVKVAVAGAAIVCLAALGRSAIHTSRAPAQAAQATHAEIKAPEPPPPAVTAEPAPPPVEAKAAEPAAAPAPDPAASAAPASTAEAAAPVKEEVTADADTAADAKEELKKAHVALERRKVADAIDAGEKSVALDPTNGEAWLILGAAYQEKGDMVNARRCYSSCIKEGKTGPRLECQKMLRF